MNSKGNYVEAKLNGENVRIYLLPGVPFKAGKIPKDPGKKIPKNEVLEIIVEAAPKEVFTEGIRERAERILGMYEGRLMDAMSVLLYAVRQERFDEISRRLEDGAREFEHIHPDMRFARTDVTSFFLKLYKDLGIGTGVRQNKEIEFYDRLGRPGLVVYPK